MEGFYNELYYLTGFSLNYLKLQLKKIKLYLNYIKIKQKMAFKKHNHYNLSNIWNL